MSMPDFEIDVSLRARWLTPLVPPDAEVAPEGAVLEREQVDSSVPEQVEPGASYERVEVWKRLRGMLA